MAPRTAGETAAGSVDVDDYTGPLQDAIHLHSAPRAQLGGATSKATSYLVFMISGNPGLIEYYRSFLNCLKDNLAKTDEEINGNTQGVRTAKDVVFEFYGHSMGGFEVQPVPQNNQLASGIGRKTCYNLQEQIDFVEQKLLAIVQKTTNQADGVAPRVILAGHSVGSYILLELIRRHRERLEATSRAKKSDTKQAPTTSTRDLSNNHDIAVEPNIVSGICLFPTVVDIGKSPQGQVFTSLLRIPAFPTIMSLVSRLLSILVPISIIQSIVKRVEGMQHHPARVVAAFFTSPRSVKQALFMADDEMRSITADRWDAEIWGTAHESPCGVPRPRLFFYFGQGDHWVADRTRDDLMAIRGRISDTSETVAKSEEWRPVMEIGIKGVTHDFCIHHSAVIASKCAEYIGAVVLADQK